MTRPSLVIKRARLLAAVLLAPAAAAAQTIPPLTVLVDASGSVRGFYETGAMDVLVTQLRDKPTDRAYSAVYRRGPEGVEGDVLPYAGRSDAIGGLTLLWRTLEDYLPEARPGEVIALVTDNIQDAGGLADEQRDIRAFYEVLRDDARFSHIFVLPLRRDFHGPLYGSDGRTRIGTYTGERGLVVYLLAYHVSSQAPILALAHEVARRLDTRAVRMKPYAGDVPVSAIVDTVATRALHPGGACDDRPLVPIAGNSKVLERADAVDEGRPFGGSFVVRLSSQMEGVSLDSPLVNASIPQEFRMDLAGVRGKVVVTPDPPRLGAELAPGDTTSVRLSVCFPNGLRFDTAQAVQQRLANARDRAGWFEGAVRVELTIPRRDLRLDSALRSEYSVSDPAFFTSLDPNYHRRIFGLEEAFRVLAPPSVIVTTRVDDYHVRFRVNLPLGRAVRRILGGLLATALAAALLLLALRKRAFQLRDDGGGHFHFQAHRKAHRRSARLMDDPLDFLDEDGADADEGTPFSLGWFGGYPVPVNGQTAGTIRNLPVFGPRLRARGSYRVNGNGRVLLLRSSGTSFSLAPAENGAGGEFGRDDEPTTAWNDTWDRSPA